MSRDIGPIKLFEFLELPAEPPAADLYGAWAQERTAWLAERPALGQHLRRHDLFQRVPAGVVDDGSDAVMPDTGFVAVSVQWFDSPAAYDGWRTDPEAAALGALDGRFRGPAVASVLTGAPDVVVGPPGGDPGSGCSLICILHRAPGMDLATFHPHWLQHHGGLFQDLPELRDPLLGYEQNHGLDVAGATYDGVTQQWFASVDAWTASVQVPAHPDIVAPDIAYFLDPERLHFIIAGPPTRIVG
jgi:EthD domain